MVFAGTHVLKGTATSVVTAIGSECEVGKIGSLLSTIKETKTPLIVKLELFGFYLSIAIILVAILTAGLLNLDDISYL